MNEILKTESVTQRFGGLDALRDVSINVYKGEIVGMIGPNGAGKTTLFNCITGIYKPTSGRVFMLGTDITGWKPYKIAEQGFSRTFQNIRLFSKMTVLDNVIVGMHTRRNKTNQASDEFRKGSKKSVQNRAEEILKLLNLYDKRFEMATSLPYGDQRKVEIARALAIEPELLLLDEPAAGMNENETEDLMNIVNRLNNMGNTIMLIEHDMKFVMNVCNRLYVLNEGKVIAEGKPKDVRENPEVIEAYLGKEE